MRRWGAVIEPRAALRRDRARLLELLDAMSATDWTRPTVCGPWLVRDVVAHILGDDLGRLSRSRDLHPAADTPEHGETLSTYLARLNDRWVHACAGLSPRTITEQLTATSSAVLSFWDQLDLTLLGEPVSWASPQPAPRWLDCARDYTEYWTHQRQIREAVAAQQISDPADDHIVNDTFLRAVPQALTAVDASAGESVTVAVDGRSGGSWSWRHDAGDWAPVDEHPPWPTAHVTFPEDVLWRLCTRGIEPGEARRRVSARGRAELTAAITAIVSIIY